MTVTSQTFELRMSSGGCVKFSSFCLDPKDYQALISSWPLCLAFGLSYSGEFKAKIKFAYKMNFVLQHKNDWGPSIAAASQGRREDAKITLELGVSFQPTEQGWRATSWSEQKGWTLYMLRSLFSTASHQVHYQFHLRDLGGMVAALSLALGQSTVLGRHHSWSSLETKPMVAKLHPAGVFSLPRWLFPPVQPEAKPTCIKLSRMKS